LTAPLVGANAFLKKAPRYYKKIQRYDSSSLPWFWYCLERLLTLFYLVELQFNRCRTAENKHRDT
jgi:hypothetical protein